ncbi:MAG: TlpA family protein disulfide reductase [Gemmatimonadota bacterium]
MSWIRASIAALLVVPVVVLFAFGLTRDPTVVRSTLPGRAAPEFALATMDPGPGSGLVGERPDSVRLSELRGRVVVLNFWASWCLACRDEHAALSAAARAYRDDGVRFYGILYQDRPALARAWIAEMGGQSYPTLLDPGSTTAIAYGLTGVPETIFIGPDGRVAHKQIGPVTRAMLRERIEALLETADGAAGSAAARERRDGDGSGPRPAATPAAVEEAAS